MANTSPEELVNHLEALVANPFVRRTWDILRGDGTIARAELTTQRLSDGHYMAIGRDRTETDQAEGALRESEHRLRFALDAAGEGLWDWDLCTGNVRHNARWSEIIGIEDGEAEHDFTVVRDRIHPDDLELVNERYARCFAGEGPFRSEHRLLASGGTYRWISSRGDVVVRGANGGALRMVPAASRT